MHDDDRAGPLSDFVRTPRLSTRGLRASSPQGEPELAVTSYRMSSHCDESRYIIVCPRRFQVNCWRICTASIIATLFALLCLWRSTQRARRLSARSRLRRTRVGLGCCAFLPRGGGSAAWDQPLHARGGAWLAEPQQVVEWLAGCHLRLAGVAEFHRISRAASAPPQSSRPGG